MKWILLILIFSCGKHEVPPQMDLRDSDGDQILNYQESEIQKHIANVDMMSEISGKLSFQADKLEIHDFFSSNKMVDSPLIKLITPDNQYRSEDYFSEITDLEIEFSKPPSELRLKYYTLNLDFDEVKNPPEKILLVTPHGSTDLGSWSKTKKIILKITDLQDIIQKKSFFRVSKKLSPSLLFSTSKEHTIRQKTYRVFFKQEDKSSCLYVTKHLEFRNLLNLLKIDGAQKVDEKSIFLAPDDDEQRWFYRERSNGDKILVFTSTSKLKSIYPIIFNYKINVLNRSNGFSQKPIVLNIPQEGNVFFKIHSINQKLVTFVETKEEKKYGATGNAKTGTYEPPYKCTHFIRKIQNEMSIFPGYHFLISQLFLIFSDAQTDYMPFSEVPFAEEITNEMTLWKSIVFTQKGQLKLNLSTLDKNSYIKTGELSNSCKIPHIYPSFLTNRESELSLIIETYLEKNTTSR